MRFPVGSFTWQEWGIALPSLDWFPRHVVDWRMRMWACPPVKASKRHGYGR